jgi:microcystin degradation protein MlrC
MGFRVAIAGISHESNTYHPDLTLLEDFELYRGDEILSRFEGTNTALGGILTAARDLDAVAIPVFFAGVIVASGTIAGKAYEALRDELLARLRAVLPVDAVALELHGAGASEDVDDLEGDLCRHVRELVGPETKVVVALDIHANVTQPMADAVELMLGNHYYPETDMKERGFEVVSLIPNLLSGELQPMTHVEYVPILTTVNTTTNNGPMEAVNNLCFELEQDPRVIDCTCYHGYTWSDTPHTGMHVVATTNGDRELAESCAAQVAGRLWGLREELWSEVPEPAEAIAQALALEGGPVILGDYADNPGGGAPGDGTHLLGAMVEADLENACYGFIYDPEVAEIAHQAGVGATISVELGGKHLDLHGPPLPMTAYVKCLTDGRFTYQAVYSGLSEDLGKMARLQLGGLDILDSSKRNQTFDPEVFLLNGIDVSRYKIVALKGCDHFKAAFAKIARAMISVDSPGMHSTRLERFPRLHAAGGLWPVDRDAEYERVHG